MEIPLLPSSFAQECLHLFLPGRCLLKSKSCETSKFPQSFVLINAKTFLLIAEFVAFSGLAPGVGEYFVILRNIRILNSSAFRESKCL